MKNIKTFVSLRKYVLIVFFICLVVTLASGYVALRTPKEGYVLQKAKPQISNGEGSTLFFASEVQKKGEIREPRVQHDEKIGADEALSKEPRLFLTPGVNLSKSQKSEILDNANELRFIVATLRTPTNDLLITLPEGTSVYEMMKVASDTQKFRFAGKDFGSGLGFFVREIDGIKENPGEGKYWIYYLNGKKANLGISNLFLGQHDVVEWKYERAGE